DIEGSSAGRQGPAPHPDSAFPRLRTQARRPRYPRIYPSRHALGRSQLGLWGRYVRWVALLLLFLPDATLEELENRGSTCQKRPLHRDVPPPSRMRSTVSIATSTGGVERPPGQSSSGT